MKNKITLLFLIFLLTNSLFSQNLIFNGDFELGAPSGVGFVTNGPGYSPLNPPFSGTTATGNFAVTTNPSLINTADFITSSDHTSGNGRMLVIDGNTTTGNPRFWKAGSTGAGATGLVVGTTYRFSYWIKSVSSLVTGPSSQADIGVQITGGTATLEPGSSTLAPLPALGWRHVVYSFTATATTTTIELWNNNISAVGNDFAVDDFVLTKDLMVSYNVTDASCVTPNPNDGSITVSGFGGTLPYAYSITGPVTLNNFTTDTFTALPPGIYTVSVTDSASPPATATIGNAVVGPSLTITPSSSAVCLGSPTTLTAAGGSSGYTWSAPLLTSGLPTNVAVPSVTVIPTAAVAHTYTATSTILACTNVTKPITITVNQLPNVTNFTGTTTICPDNTTLITISGTPGSTVTFVNDQGDLPYTKVIPTSGTTTWTTPVLTATTVYTLQSIRNNASPFCETTYPVGPAPAPTVTIEVVPNGCATVTTVPAPGTPDLDLTLCSPGECRDLKANISPLPSTTSYAVSDIPYCPYPFTDPDPINNPTYNVVDIPTSGTNVDDFWSDVITLPFNFCFYGNDYTQCNVGTNGLLTFRSIPPGVICEWPDTNVQISNITNQLQSIFGVFQDTDMNIPPSAADRQVNWVLQGTYPCRKLIVNFYNLGQWSSIATNPGLQTSQIVLYEVSNIIEVFVQRRVAGSPWSGSGVIGLIGASGLQSIAPPGFNTGNWSANMKAWRFTPTGTTVPVTIKFYEEPAHIQIPNLTADTARVCPNTTTTYSIEAVYDVCTVSQTATTSVELEVKLDLTNDPRDITQCTPNTTATFDLTSNNSFILSGVSDPAPYIFTYHLTAADAASRSFAIPNPSAFASIQRTIYVAIYWTTFGCTVVKPFELIISCNSCPSITIPTGTQNLCSGADPAILSVNTTSTGTDAISFVYFTTAQTGSTMYTGGIPLGNGTPSAGIASYNPGVLGTPGSLPNISDTYYVYAIVNPTPADATCRPFQEIKVIVNASPPPSAPTISTVSPTCSAAGTSTISNYSSANTYTFTPATAGISINASGLISGMIVDTNYIVSASNGSCTTSASSLFSNPAQLTFPAVPIITSVVASCSVAGSATISNYNASNTYTFSPAGPTVGVGGVISSMTFGTSYTVTAGNVSCTSLASDNFIINVQPVTPVLSYTVTNTVCNGSTLDFAFIPSITGTTYIWSATASNISGFYNTTTSGNETNINNVATLTNPEAIGTITMVIIPRANGCDGTPQTVIITVNPNPVVEVVAVADTSVCSATSAINNVQVNISGNISGITYNWTAITNGVTVVGGPTSGTITATSTTASFGLQVITSNPLVAGTISFEVISVKNGCIGNTLPSTVVNVNPNPGVAISSPDKLICSGDPTDLMIDVSPLITGTEIEWEVLTVVNVSGANPGSGIAPQPINDILTSTTGGYVIYRIRTSLGECEGSYTDYRVNVDPVPLPILADGNICITAAGVVYQTYTLNTGLNNTDYDFEWFDSSGNIIPGETNATLVVDEAGTYSVISTNWLTGCSSAPTLSTATATVTETMPATTMTVVQSEYFSDNATITVSVTGGTGTLMYSLDEGPLQSSNVFTGVSAGEHTVNVMDTESCTYLTEVVPIIDYPHYFTPNGDGIHDTWNVVGLADKPGTKIFIFDRYGKLIKQISSRDAGGWNGTYNGNPMPSDDYWFTVEFEENGIIKQYKSHFAMKR